MCFIKNDNKVMLKRKIGYKVVCKAGNAYLNIFDTSTWNSVNFRAYQMMYVNDRKSTYGPGFSFFEYKRDAMTLKSVLEGERTPSIKFVVLKIKGANVSTGWHQMNIEFCGTNNVEGYVCESFKIIREVQ